MCEIIEGSNSACASVGMSVLARDIPKTKHPIVWLPNIYLCKYAINICTAFYIKGRRGTWSFYCLFIVFHCPFFLLALCNRVASEWNIQFVCPFHNTKSSFRPLCRFIESINFHVSIFTSCDSHAIILHN